MKHCSVKRVAAVAAVTCLLSLSALPAAAAPVDSMASDGLWTPASLFNWIQSVWAGWFGGVGEAGETSGVWSTHDAIRQQLDPDGSAVAISIGDDDPKPGSDSSVPST